MNQHTNLRLLKYIQFVIHKYQNMLSKYKNRIKISELFILLKHVMYCVYTY